MAVSYASVKLNLFLTIVRIIERNSFSVGYLTTPLSNQWMDWTFLGTDLNTNFVLCHSALKTASLVARNEWQVNEWMSFVTHRGAQSDPTVMSSS